MFHFTNFFHFFYFFYSFWKYILFTTTKSVRYNTLILQLNLESTIHNVRTTQSYYN